MNNKGLVLGELMIAICIILMLMTACSATTTIKDPDGRMYEIVSQKDAVVRASLNNGVSIFVDNSGPRSIIGTVLDAWLFKSLTADEGEK